MTGPCYALVWADSDLFLRVVGVYATRPQAERAAATEVDVALEWVDYVNDRPPRGTRQIDEPSIPSLTCGRTTD
jgi:hypothetical protein